MASENITLNIRERGAQKTASQIDKTGKAVGRFGSKAKHTSTQMRTLTSASAATGRSVSHLRGILTGAGLSFAGLALGVRHVVLAYENQRKITAQTAAVIKSTGGAAHVTDSQVANLADTFSKKTAVDDEQIQQGLNMMLSFRRVRNEVGKNNDVFTQAGQAAQDMSAFFIASGKDLDVATASLQIGKALNDPTKGITRLTRQGVTFTDQQKNQIKALQDSGDLMGAQKVIIRELGHEFGGTAAAVATPLGRMRVAVDNISEALGKGLSPATDAAATAIGKLAARAEPKLLKLGDRLKKLFGRKDLTIEQKISLGGKDAKRTLAPFEREIARSFKRIHIGDRFLRWWESALPKMAAAAGRGGARIAWAFAGGFISAGILGKLTLIGWIFRRRIGDALLKGLSWIGNRFASLVGQGIRNGLKSGILGKLLKIGLKGLKFLGIPGAIASFLVDAPNAGPNQKEEDASIRRGAAKQRANRRDAHPNRRRTRPAAHTGRVHDPVVIHTHVKVREKEIGKAVTRYNDDRKARR